MGTDSNQRYRADATTFVSGNIRVPGDKSISHRALMLAAIANGRSTISGFLRGEDCLATLEAMRSLGVRIGDTDTGIIVDGVGLRGLRQASGTLDLGNSGTAMRLMTGLLAGQAFDSVLTGDDSLLSRPMERVAEPLNRMDADVRTDRGHPPIRIGGGRSLHGIAYDMPVASAQVKSAILLAGLYAEGTTIVRSPGICRDHTERMLSSMGGEIEFGEHESEIAIRPVETLDALDITIPGDFSSAAFFIVAACLGARDGLRIRDVGMNPTRTGLIEILRAMGADIGVLEPRTVGAEPVADLVVRQSDLRGIDVPSELVPLAIDEFPALFVAAVGAEGVTRVRGAGELRLKESDRLAVMATALSRLGATVRETPDGLLVEGGRLSGGVVDSRGDHRIAMAMVVASLRAGSTIEILNTEQVATSYPAFAETARGVGFGLEVVGGADR